MWCVLGQSQVATIIVIVTDVATYEPDEVAPTKNDYVLKEFPPVLDYPC